MSDYVYILESHLSPDQNRVVSDVKRTAAEANLNLFLTGGAMRDMLGGFPIRDLDFVVEGNALKLARSLAESSGATLLAADEVRKSAEMVFPGGVTSQIATAHQEKHGRPGTKPQISAATIQEDLRGRDFTCNAIALSLNKASHGLLLDPMNGLADIERRELRAISPYGFYDDPSRLLRLIRFRVRLAFTVEERTQMQVGNAREAEVEQQIPGRLLGEELKRIAAEDSPLEILRALDEAGLLTLFSPALTGARLNAAGIGRFEKASRTLPDDAPSRSARLGSFLHALTEKLTAKERQALVKTLELGKSDIDRWQKLEARAHKLEAVLRSPRIRKASQVYHTVSAALPDEVLFLLYHSTLKPVQERLRNYFQKYLPAVQEITAEEWATVEGKPGTPKYQKAQRDFVSTRLDRRVRKVETAPVEPSPEAAPTPEVAAVAGRRAR